MPYVTVGSENSATTDLYYEDHGSGSPVVLIHGFPLDGHSWEKQVPVLLDAGHRVVTYDRRGFGNSSQPSFGYDYDTLTNDLDALLTTLDLHDVTLVGFSMGTGEVTHYLGTRGSGRVSRAVLLAPLPPFLLKTPDNPEGVDRAVFQKFMKDVLADRPAFLKAFFDDFYNVDGTGDGRVSDAAYWSSWTVATRASAIGTLACIGSWLTDFRADLSRIDVPVLAVQGDQDRILPLDSTGRRLAGLVNDLRFVVIEGAPHAITWTHAEQVNRALLDFIGSATPRRATVG